jgi:hypothetical protein
MKLKILSFLLLFAIIITSCNTSNKVVLIKRQLAKGNNQLAIGNTHTSTKKIKTIETKKIVLVDDRIKNPKPDRMKNLSGNDDLIASADEGTVILSNPKNILADDYSIQQKVKTDEQITNVNSKEHSQKLSTGLTIAGIILLSFILFFVIVSIILIFWIVFRVFSHLGP